MSAVVLSYHGSLEDEREIGPPPSPLHRLMVVDQGEVWLPVEGLTAVAAALEFQSGVLRTNDGEVTLASADWLKTKMPGHSEAIDRIIAVALASAADMADQPPEGRGDG